jgi:4-hydroxybenzoate polyprenyltransferase
LPIVLLLPKNSKKISYIIISLAIIVSLFEIHSLIYIIISSILGFIYNEFSRKIILGDSLVAGMTHFSLPLFFTGIITKTNMDIVLPITIIAFFIAPTIAPITNIKDIKEDKKRNYKTLINTVKNPFKTIKISLIILPIIFTIISIIIKNFELIIFQIILFPLIVKIKNLIVKKQFKRGLILLRTYLVYSYYFIILLTTKNIEITFVASIINLINFIQTIKNYK